MTTFHIQLATVDGHEVRIYAFAEDGDGSVRDCNHAQRCVDVFTDGWEAIAGRPPQGATVFFEVTYGIRETRRGVSSYVGCDYRTCTEARPPLHIIAWGMEIFAAVKRVLRKAARETEAKGKAVA